MNKCWAFLVPCGLLVLATACDLERPVESAHGKSAGRAEEQVGKRQSASTTTQTPFLCSSTGNLFFIELSDKRKKLSNWRDMPDKNDSETEYSNMVHVPWKMLFSHHVSDVGFYFGEFRVEEKGWQLYDYLKIGHGSGEVTYYGSPTGTGANHNPPPTNGTMAGPFPTKSSFGTPSLDFTWHTDSSYTYYGYEVEWLNITCTENTAAVENVTRIEPNTGYDGFLMNSGDVIYLKVDRHRYADMSLLLWNQGYADFDLYVSTNPAITKPSVNDIGSPGVYHSWEYGTGKEMIVLPKEEGTTYDTVYISIHAYDGGGLFRFYANSHRFDGSRDGEHNAAPKNINVIVPFQATNDQKTQIRNILLRSAKAAYFASGGRHLIEKFDVHWGVYLPLQQWVSKGITFHNYNYVPTAKCNRKWWVDRDQGEDHWDDSGVTLNPSDWCQSDVPPPATCSRDPEVTALTIVHELGHCAYHSLWDEDHDDDWDNVNEGGHSLMQWHGSQNRVAFCSKLNGGYDAQHSSHKHAANKSNWYYLSNWPGAFWGPVAYPHDSRTPDGFNPVLPADNKPFSYIVSIVDHEY